MVRCSRTGLDWHEVEKCNLCGSTEKKLYMESHVPEWYDNRPLRLVECENCGLVFASPRPDPLQLYQDYIAGAADASDVVQRKLARQGVHDTHRRRVQAAIDFLGRQPRRLFDMGCGAGTVMMAADELGIEAVGNDVNKFATEMLNDRGLKAYHGFTSDLDLQDDDFDVVTNFDYLEHSYTPLQDLETAFRITKPGGLLYLKTLYLGCPAHVESGEAWRLFGIGHFHFFTPEVLIDMIEKVGYEIRDVQEGQLIFVAAGRPPDSADGHIGAPRWKQRSIELVKETPKDWQDVTSCNFCGGEDFELYMKSGEPNWYEDQPIRLIRCADCGLVLASPRPDPLTLYKNYLAGGESQKRFVNKKLSRPNVLQRHQSFVKRAQKHLPRKAERLYDMGCGAGTIMMGARALRIQAEGNDVNKAAIDMLQGLGFKVELGFTSDLDLPDDAYDIVFNLDYLDHTYTPFDDLKACFRIAKPGGILYLKTIYLDCPDHREMRDAWKVFSRSHFSFFDAEVLEKIVTGAGFEILEIEKGGHITIIGRKPSKNGLAQGLMRSVQSLAKSIGLR